MRPLIATIVVLAVAGAAAAVYHQGGGLPFMGDAAPPAEAAPQAMPVQVTKPERRTIPIYLDYSARTEAIQSVTLQAKVSGYLVEQATSDGSDVRKGDLLYTIDPRDYQAALDAAKAELKRDTAALDYARASQTRGNELARTGYLSKDTFDQRNSNLKQADAAIAISKAAITTAELNLGYTRIAAPFDGRLGQNQASRGTLVTAGTTPLNTLVQLAPIYVTFNPSETELSEISAAMARGKVEVEVTQPDTDTPPRKGELSFVDNAVNRVTGTITARATLANADRTLLPGQYVRIRVKIRDEANAMLVPQTTIGSSQFGKFVYVVGAGNAVELKLVTLGPTEGSLVVVRQGLSNDSQVIDGNLQKIGPGMPVQPMPAKPASGS